MISICLNKNCVNSKQTLSFYFLNKYCLKYKISSARLIEFNRHKYGLLLMAIYTIDFQLATF